MIIAGHLALPEAARPGQSARPRLHLAQGWIVLEGSQIQALTLGPCPHTPDLGGPDSLVFPGFLDAHLHLPQFDCIGADGMELLPWLQRIIFPAETRWSDRDFAGQMSARAARRLLSVGTTGIAAYATVHHESALAAAQSLHNSGLRAIVGQVLMDRAGSAPDELLRPTAQLLDEASRFDAALRQRFPDGRIQPAITPRFALACSEELLHGAGKLAVALNAPVQTHLAETRAECDAVGHLFPRRSYTRVYLESGLLTPRSLLGHGIFIDDQDRAILKRTGAAIAHCPTANLFLNSGPMDRAGHRRAGVRLALGSDIAGGNEISMVRVARSMLDTCKLRGQHPPSAAEAWWQITAGNADAMGWPDQGRLAAGAAADLVIVRPTDQTSEFLQHGNRALAQLLYSWDDRWIRNVIAAGKPVFTAPTEESRGG